MTNEGVSLLSGMTRKIKNITDTTKRSYYSKHVAKTYYVYIMASYLRTLYVGVTNHLERRVNEHKNKLHDDSFSARYNISRLVYVEETNNILEAIAREKQLKRWRREKKVFLVEQQNPAWHDLSET